MADDYKTEKDGFEPDESRAKPDECSVPIERTVFDASDIEPVQDCERMVSDELHVQFPIEEIPAIIDKDGIATVVTPPKEGAMAAPFTYDIVCIQDDREWVEVFENEGLVNIWGTSLECDSDLGSILIGDSQYKVFGYYGQRVAMRPQWDLDGSPAMRMTILFGEYIQKFGFTWLPVDKYVVRDSGGVGLGVAQAEDVPDEHRHASHANSGC